jgi:benzoate/toluate 1,2-dioxygenase alpha subunit
MLDTVRTTLDTALEDDAAKGVFRVSRDIFTKPEIFELEMKHIFEGN